MKKHTTLSEIRLSGNQALLAELGPADFTRFMQQFVSRGDYTKDRDQWIDRLDMSDLDARVKTMPVRTKRKAG